MGKLVFTTKEVASKSITAFAKRSSEKNGEIFLEPHVDSFQPSPRSLQG
jgi:hypothetical protein